MQAHKKACDENKSKKNDNRIIFVVEGGIYKASSEEWRDQF